MSLDSLLRATGKNLLPNPNVHAYNYSSDYKKYNNTDEIFLTAGTYSISVSANCPTLQFWNVTTKQQYTVNEAVSAYSTNTYYKIYDGFALGRASDAVRQMWFTLKINTLITLNSGNTNGTSQECQIEKGSTATTYEPYEYLGPKTIKMGGNSKNLIQYPYIFSTKTKYGVTFTVQPDGGIKVEGTVNDSEVPQDFFLEYLYTPTMSTLNIKTNTTYTFSGFKSGNGVSLIYNNLNSAEGEISTVGQSFTFNSGTTKSPLVAIKVIKGVAINALLYPQLEEGSVATDYELNTGSKEVLKVSYNSKNLFNKSLPIADINVTATAVRQGYKIPVNAGVYTVSGGSNVTFCKTLIGDTYGTYHSLENAITLTLNTKGYILIYSVGSEPITATVDTLQLELGNKKTDYVPYFNTTVWTKKA